MRTNLLCCVLWSFICPVNYHSHVMSGSTNVGKWIIDWTSGGCRYRYLFSPWFALDWLMWKLIPGVSFNMNKILIINFSFDLIFVKAQSTSFMWELQNKYIALLVANCPFSLKFETSKSKRNLDLEMFEKVNETSGAQLFSFLANLENENDSTVSIRHNLYWWNMLSSWSFIGNLI